MTDAAKRIEQIRQWRTSGRPQRDPAIASLIRKTADEAARTQKKLGALIELWEQLLPPELASRTTIVTLRGGTAHVSVDSAATAYEIDRRLREGLLTQLRSRYPGTLARVRVKQDKRE